MAGPQEADAYMVVGDLEPPLDAVLLDATGQPMNLSQATHVYFQAKHQTRETTITGECAITQPFVDPVTQQPTGKVEYVWSSGDTDHSGYYDFTFRIVWSGGRSQTVPNYTYKQLLIRDVT